MIAPSELLWIGALALALDWLWNRPQVWRRVAHPVVLIGAVIARWDKALNREKDPIWLRRLSGVGLVLVLTGTGFAAGHLVQHFLLILPLGWLWLALAASIFLALRNLDCHVREVARAFETGLPAARAAVSMIVGRQTAHLDEAGISRAAIESAAENFSDGVIAPLFWFCLLGLPGLIAYKAINTADSMVGHRSARHEAFGWAAARLDDVANLVPARLSGMLIALAAPVVGGRVGASLAAMWRDAHTHASPNAGWPEAAMAGALGVALAGPRIYPSGPVEAPWLNAPGRTVDAGDIPRAVLVIRAAGLAAVLAALLTHAGS